MGGHVFIARNEVDALLTSYSPYLHSSKICSSDESSCMFNISIQTDNENTVADFTITLTSLGFRVRFLFIYLIYALLS